MHTTKANNSMHSLLDTCASVKMEKIVTRPALLKDIKKLSTQHQTSSLEAFHSLILTFAPKHSAFSYMGMYCRYSVV